jgi:hypothetical protein
MLQKRKRMVKALASDDMVFTMTAAYSAPGAKRVKKRDIIMKSGAPGGCPTSSL